MTQELFLEARQEYVVHLQNIIKRLNLLPIPVFKTIAIDCTKLNCNAKRATEDNMAIYNQMCEQLRLNGVSEKSKVLYYFKIISKHSKADIHAEVYRRKRKKKTSKHYLALPKINISHQSDVLYVGKTNSNFPIRLMHHLGMVESHTYALQLGHWGNSLGLEVELCYSAIDISTDDIAYLEIMETSLHNKLQPILGRSGH